MSPDIRETLHGAARSPGMPVDPDDLRERGARRRVGQVVGGAAMAVVVGVAGINALGRPARLDGPPVITELTPGPSDPTPSGPVDDVRVVGAAELGRSIITTLHGDPMAIVHHPDGSTNQRQVSQGPAGRWYPDASGGIWWQDVCTGSSTGTCPSGSFAINHTDADGTSREVIPPSQTMSVPQLWSLVGPGLATRRTGDDMNGTNEDLLSVGLDGQTEVLRASISGWESGLGEAVAFETVLYSMVVEAGALAVLSPPAAEPITVWQGGDDNGLYVYGVAHHGATGVVLISPYYTYPDYPASRLLMVSPTGTVSEEIEVPANLGTNTVSLPQEISVEGGLLLVNRRSEEGWLNALVLDLDTGDWSVYDQPGLSKFAG